ncbi:hypothetical protein JVU11DRAFT_9291 [Chiua virens]|nr:hypothetical protein JVU11DRAFT_9291 [Chiua virens]
MDLDQPVEKLGRHSEFLTAFQKNHRFIVKQEHHQPSRMRKVEWPAHSLETWAPTTCAKDSQATRFMASGPPAEDLPYGIYPLVVAINPQGLAEDVIRIRNILSHGSAVLLRGWRPEALVEVTMEAIEGYMPPVDQKISYQDARERERLFGTKLEDRVYNSIIKFGTLKDFVEAAREGKEVWNCLDLPCPDQEVPALVRRLMDDQYALRAVHREGYSAAPSADSPRAVVTDTAPRVMYVDGLNSTGWDLITHAGFLTYPHHDAAGYLTFSFMRGGGKFWGYIILKDVDHQDQRAVIDAWDRYYTQPLAAETVDRGVEVGTVVLEEDAVLIQPPGINHMVYTPCHSVTSGGHMYCYDTMHLTEFAVVYDFGLDQGGERRPSASNSAHPGMLQKICRMAMALPAFAPTRQFHRRCLIGIRSIIDRLEQRVLEEEAECPPLSEWEIISLELNGDRARALDVLDGVMSLLGVGDAFVEMRKGDWRDPGPLVNLGGLF